MKAWKSILEVESKVNRLIMIGKIFDNNNKMYELIANQIKLLEKYEDDFKDIMPVKDYIDGYEKMLNIVGLTASKFNDEWDDEVDRKS